ncbi:LrgB family protein [Pseudoalteromonas sp.]|uniref:LrgB family protein n=1 Tax=Pseudoalteromonas sp. TaxID=53249 RepID=UPI0035618D8A
MSLFLIVICPICFFAFKWLQTHYFKHSLCNPILLSISLISLVLIWSDISYAKFAEVNTPFFWLLDLAIVALAIPLYKESNTIKKATWRYILCSVTGVASSSIIAMLTAHSLGASEKLVVSLAPNAVTTPIAIEVSNQLAGISALSAVVVICVGIFGAVIGLPLLSFFGVKHVPSQGLALGAACHAVGTARAIEVSERMGAFASVSLVLSAILTPVLLPLIYTVISHLFTLQ